MRNICKVCIKFTRIVTASLISSSHENISSRNARPPTNTHAQSPPLALSLTHTHTHAHTRTHTPWPCWPHPWADTERKNTQCSSERHLTFPETARTCIYMYISGEFVIFKWCILWYLITQLVICVIIDFVIYIYIYVYISLWYIYIYMCDNRLCDIYIYICVYFYMYTCICLHVYICVCIHICIYIYIYMVTSR